MSSLSATIQNVFNEPGCGKNANKSEAERKKGCTKQLQPGASAQFDLTYTLLHDSAQVAAVEQKIAKIQGDNKVAENETPIAKE
ncbi:MAG: hypothetical protein E6614_24855 [Bradyrhizobium sp.]|nr:hypothetical protein [Bradyrhizobium sp.]